MKAKVWKKPGALIWEAPWRIQCSCGRIASFFYWHNAINTANEHVLTVHR